MTSVFRVVANSAWPQPHWKSGDISGNPNRINATNTRPSYITQRPPSNHIIGHSILIPETRKKKPYYCFILRTTSWSTQTIYAFLCSNKTDQVFFYSKITQNTKRIATFVKTASHSCSSALHRSILRQKQIELWQPFYVSPVVCWRCWAVCNSGDRYANQLARVALDASAAAVVATPAATCTDQPLCGMWHE